LKKSNQKTFGKRWAWVGRSLVRAWLESVATEPGLLRFARNDGVGWAMALPRPAISKSFLVTFFQKSNRFLD
jgi:hypothetical protein